MKKNIILTVLLLVLAFAFSSCEKKKEWKYRYGYSIDDIVGEYTFSNIEGAFEDGLIENQDCHICKNALCTVECENVPLLHSHISGIFHLPTLLA